MRTTIFILFIVGLSVCWSLPAFALDNSQGDARTYLVRGMAAVEMATSAEELIDAVVEFKKATELDPGMSAAWYNLGTAQARLGQLNEAIDSYNRYLTLAPQADDAQKVRDAVIKLGYRLDKAARFTKISGRWISPNGTLAHVEADKGKIRIKFQGSTYFADSAEVWITGVLNKPPTTYEYGTSSFDLDLVGRTLDGFFEFSDNSHSDGWCIIPSERDTAKGILDNGRMQLNFKKAKYKVFMDYEASLFAKTKVYCQNIYPVDSLTKELILMGPLGDGGLNARLTKTETGRYSLKTTADSATGLEDGDEIVSVDDLDASQLDIGEIIMKLNGTPGSPVKLSILRKKTREPSNPDPTDKVIAIVNRVKINW